MRRHHGPTAPVLNEVFFLGDRIIVVVQKQRSFGAETPGGSSLGITNKVRRGDIRHAVVVRAKKEEQRKDGSLIRFDDNACVLINKNGDPIGTRLTSKAPSGPNVVASANFHQASWEPSFDTSSGRRSCLWRPCMYNDGPSNGKAFCTKTTSPAIRRWLRTL